MDNTDMGSEINSFFFMVLPGLDPFGSHQFMVVNAFLYPLDRKRITFRDEPVGLY